MIFIFTYKSSKLEVLNNNDNCSKSVASSLKFSIQFFKTQLQIPRNRCATFFKRLGDTCKHTLHCGRFCRNLSKKYEVRYRIVANASPSCFEAHVGLFTLLMKGIFDPYVHTLDTGQKFKLINPRPSFLMHT
jgi:hypothetical protein